MRMIGVQSQVLLSHLCGVAPVTGAQLDRVIGADHHEAHEQKALTLLRGSLPLQQKPHKFDLAHSNGIHQHRPQPHLFL
jgi:hypothetical protein